MEHQLKLDQEASLNPDYETPFTGRLDACKRLVRYHVMQDLPEPDEAIHQAEDQIYEENSRNMLVRFDNMLLKYQHLLHKESTVSYYNNYKRGITTTLLLK